MRNSSFAKTPTLFIQTAAVAALALFLGLYSSLVSAQQTGPMDDKAMQVLQGMSDYLAKADTVSFRARTFFDEVRQSGIKIKAARENKILLKRPGSFYAESVAENGAARTVWFDGSTFTVWNRHANQYMALDFKGTTDALIDHLDDKYGINLPVADLLFSNVGEAFKESIISSEYLGERMVQGVRCHHLSFESTGADWQIWIEADATPLPRRFVVTYVNDKGEPQFMAQLDQWSLGEDIDANLFRAAVPEHVKKTEFGAR
ncbi:MAG: DUF2092 domain-containing protein [Hyphomicrobiales bacterium]|nr:DUF2092 domain-containing protein [Hyphomicrobiales bacterium]